MEEILASIRRIISDDEASTVQQRATSSEYAEQVRAGDTEDGAADTQMIDHLARALGSATPSPANDDDIDDILDLTEPGGSASEDVMMPDEPAAVRDEVVLETDSYVELRPKLDFAAAFPPQEQSTPAEYPNAGAAPSLEPASTYADPAHTAEDSAIVVEMPAPKPVMVAQTTPSLDDPTTALERAIAALKAGDLAAFAREAQSDYAAPEPTYVPLEPAYAAPQPVPEAPPAESYSEPEPASFEPEPPLVAEEKEEAVVFLAEPEAEPEPSGWAGESPSWSQIVEASPEPEVEPDPAPWRGEEFSWGRTAPANEFELNAARVNGGSDHEQHDFTGPVLPKSLEDSVKEMLRPLLKQWLDENMPRVLTAALREELENSDIQRRG
jgi:uncharacterized protein